MAKHFACNGDGNLPCIGLSIEAIAQIGKNGDIRYLCSACGRPVVIEELPCDHKWIVDGTVFDYWDMLPIKRHCSYCGLTQTGTATVEWPND